MNELRSQVIGEVRKVVVGQEYSVDVLLAAATVGGHVLLEGVPGTAKTLLANAFARALGLEFRRVQFTADMLPSDVTGTMTMRDPAQLSFRPGPVFTNVLLADEINRTPPKTQAALLEAMQEGQVTVDGVSHPLPQPFLVIATQNPIEYEGTYPLPEAQLDRFFAKLEIGYPSAEDELRIIGLAHHGLAPATLSSVQPVTTAEKLLAARADVGATRITDEVTHYAVALVRATRSQPSVLLGASPRAAVHLVVAAKSAARIGQRDFVTPDDIRAVAPAVLAHRLVMRPEAEFERFTAANAIRNVLESVTVPR
jgi:MoxR-like ATPase